MISFVLKPKLSPIFFFLAIVHIVIVILSQNLAADELETPSVEDIEASEISAIRAAELDIFTGDYGMRFVAIPPGNYVMGSPPHELGRVYIFEDQHEINIENQFYLQTTEVTQGQWEAVMGNNPSFFNDCGEKCPVENVSWLDVHRFIKKLNRHNKTNRYRLPTEAEWEYACRAGSTTAFSNGDVQAFGCHENSRLESIAWYRCNSDNMPHPVGRKIPNKMGLYDMHGNVNEWCQDEFKVNYSDNFKKNAKKIYAIYDKVVRGGSWSDSPPSCRSAARYNLKPSWRGRRVGFRLVRESKYYKIKTPPSLEPAIEVPENGKPDTVEALPEPEPSPQINPTEPDIYTLQMESTKSLDYAERQVMSFKKMGHPAFYVKVNIPGKGIWYRICLGKFKSRSEADLVRKQLAREKIDSIVLKL